MFKLYNFGKEFIPLSKIQINKRDELYNYLIKIGPEEISVEKQSKLGSICFSLIESLILTSINHDNKIASPTEGVIIIRCLLSDGSWNKNPNVVTQAIAAFQFCVRSVVFTKARLIHEELSSYSPPKLSLLEDEQNDIIPIILNSNDEEEFTDDIGVENDINQTEPIYEVPQEFSTIDTNDDDMIIEENSTLLKYLFFNLI